MAVPQQLAALQAKVIGRLMEPERLPWKAYLHHWLYRSREWLDAQGPALQDTSQHIWQPGRFLIFSSLDVRHTHLPARVGADIRAYRQLAPHRLKAPGGLPCLDIRHEPLFHSRCILDPTTHLPLAWPAWARRAILRVGDLRALVSARPEDSHIDLRVDLPTTLAARPAIWRAALQCDAPQAQ